MKKNGEEFLENLAPDDGRIGYKSIGSLKEINDAIDKFWERRGRKKITFRDIIKAGTLEKKEYFANLQISKEDFYET